MHRITTFLFASALTALGTASSAYDVGDVAYICTKNQKFAWVIGPDTWSACPVRILQRAGGSYKVLAHRKSCILPGFGAGMINKGRDAWLEGYQLWSSGSACENQGKPRTTPKPPAPKPAPAPSASNATSFDMVARMESNLENQEGLEDGFGKMFALIIKDALLPELKKNPRSLRLANKCEATVYASFKWTTSAGREEIRQWTLEPTEGMKSYSLAVDGKAVADGKSSVLMHVRTTSGREIWAGSQGTANFNNGKAYFREMRLHGRPRYIELCPE